MTDPLDRAMLAGLADVVDKATAGLRGAGTTPARLEVTETFFWTFCDDYLELVKDRAYGGQGDAAAAASARAALRLALDVLLRLLAPFLPVRHRGGLVLVARRVGAPRRLADARRGRRAGEAATRRCWRAVGAALAGVRKAKSEAKVGMRAEVPSMTLAGPAAALDQIRSAVADLSAAGKIADITYADAEHVEVRDVVLVPVPKS